MDDTLGTPLEKKESNKEKISIPNDYETAISEFKKIIDSKKQLKTFRKLLIKKGLGMAFVVLTSVKNKKGKIDIKGLKEVYKKAGEKGDFVLVYDCAPLLGDNFIKKAREFAVREAKADKGKRELATKMFLANSDEKGIKMLST